MVESGSHDYKFKSDYDVNAEILKTMKLYLFKKKNYGDMIQNFRSSNGKTYWVMTIHDFFSSFARQN